MLISGVQKFTLLDFPLKTACIVFTPGCNFRCPYCYNSDFVIPEKIEKIKDIFIPEDIFFNFLKTRTGFLDGVVISGGEPTLQTDIIEFIKKIKNFNYKIKLDTNGTNFEIVKKIIGEKLIDYIAMDIKAPIEKYKDVVNVKVDTNIILKTIELIKNSSIDYEFRTTVVKEQLSIEDLNGIGKIIFGANKYYLQKFRNNNETLNVEFKDKTTYSDSELKYICDNIKNNFNISVCDFR